MYLTNVKRAAIGRALGLDRETVVRILSQEETQTLVEGYRDAVLRIVPNALIGASELVKTRGRQVKTQQDTARRKQEREVKPQQTSAAKDSQRQPNTANRLEERQVKTQANTGKQKRKWGSAGKRGMPPTALSTHSETTGNDRETET